VADALPTLLAPLRLPAFGGDEVRLGSLWERAPAALVFLRHFGCIFCRAHVARLSRRAEAFRDAGAIVVAVGFGSYADAERFRRDVGLTLPLLVDEERRAYRTLRLRRACPLSALGPADVRARLAARAEGHRNRWLARHALQLGGSFVFAPHNVQRLAHYNRRFFDDASPDTLLAALARG
jgi:hypothetical protein